MNGIHRASDEFAQNRYLFHSICTEANSTESVLKMFLVNSPTTISWLSGRTAVIQLYRGVLMWLANDLPGVSG